jgi:multifunctional methyltransferase subunit TRM112
MQANEVRETNVDFKPEFVQRMIPKMEWIVFKEAAGQLGVELPSEAPEQSPQPNEDLLKKIHHAMFEIEVVQGELICPETGRKFTIKQGIPNMLCNEDEV